MLGMVEERSIYGLHVSVAASSFAAIGYEGKRSTLSVYIVV